MTVIDGKIKPQRNRHRLDFYVRIHYNQEQFIDTPIDHSLEPIWEQGYLLKGYDFPFFFLDLMNQSKGLRDYSIGRGRLHVAPVLEKQVNVKNLNEEFQGRIRLSVEYPRGSIYEFTLNSIKVIKPSDDRMPKDQFFLRFPFNPHWSITF